MSSEFVRPLGDVVAQEAELAVYSAAESSKTVINPMMRDVRQTLEAAGVTYEDLTKQTQQERRNRAAVSGFVANLPIASPVDIEEPGTPRSLRRPMSLLAPHISVTEYQYCFSTNKESVVQGLKHGNSMMWLGINACKKTDMLLECRISIPAKKIPFYVVGEKHTTERVKKRGIFNNREQDVSSYLLAPAARGKSGRWHGHDDDMYIKNLLVAEFTDDEALTTKKLLEDHDKSITPEELSQMFDRKSGRFILKPDAFPHSPVFKPGNIKGGLEYITDHTLLGFKVSRHLAKLASIFNVQEALKEQLAKITER